MAFVITFVSGRKLRLPDGTYPMKQYTANLYELCKSNGESTGVVVSEKEVESMIDENPFWADKQE